jgi:hypothetical protein
MTQPTHEPISPATAELIASVRAKQAQDHRLVVSAKIAGEMLNLSGTCIRGLINSGALPSYTEGTKRHVLVCAIYDRLVDQLIAAQAGAGPLPKVRTFRGQRPHELAVPKRKPG